MILQHEREGMLTRIVTKMLKLCMMKDLALQYYLTGVWKVTEGGQTGIQTHDGVIAAGVCKYFP